MEMAAAFPEEWARVAVRLAEMRRDAEQDPEAVHRHLAEFPQPSRPARTKEERRAAVSLQHQRRMAAAALRQARLSAIAGVERGRVRSNLLDGDVARKLPQHRVPGRTFGGWTRANRFGGTRRRS